MRTPSKSRETIASGAVGLAIVLVAGGPARAQVCAATADRDTVCALMLSRPESFTIDARLLRSRGGGRVGPLALYVNGKPCRGSASGFFGRLHARCRLLLPAGGSTIQAALTRRGAETSGVSVTLTSSSRLAAIPAEADQLNGSRRKGGERHRTPAPDDAF